LTTTQPGFQGRENADGFAADWGIWNRDTISRLQLQRAAQVRPSASAWRSGQQRYGYPSPTEECPVYLK